MKYIQTMNTVGECFLDREWCNLLMSSSASLPLSKCLLFTHRCYSNGDALQSEYKRKGDGEKMRRNQEISLIL